MGYYVELQDADFTIPENEETLSALREMTVKYRAVMRGGSSTEKWFSWMSNEEIENATSAQSIFEALGFDCENYGNNTFGLRGYSSKTGQEDLFLAVVAPFVAEDSYTEWRGEDGEMWRYVVRDKKLCVQSSKIAWNYPEQYMIRVFHSTGSFDDNTFRSLTSSIDPYGDIEAQVAEKKAKVTANA